jgi:hypothetical protein
VLIRAIRGQKKQRLATSDSHNSNQGINLRISGKTIGSKYFIFNKMISANSCNSWPKKAAPSNKRFAPTTPIKELICESAVKLFGASILSLLK